MAVRVCFVCLGNICRSPTAEGVMRRLVDDAGLAGEIEVDSAGTAAHHVGESADPRSADKARERGVHLNSVARQFERRDFARFEYVLAMDRENRDHLHALAPDDAAVSRVSLLRAFGGAPEADVPDPYYGGARGLHEVFDICEAACEALLAHIREAHGL